MATRKSRVLWVSFDFPPRQSSAVYRPIKIYKYMDKEAFEVDFLTQSFRDHASTAILDDTLMQDVSPQPRVHKVANWVPHDALLRLARRRKRSPKSPPAAGGVLPQKKAASPDGFGKSLYGKMVMRAYFPDQYCLWGSLSALAALRLHLRRRYDLVYTTSYPESCHMAGLLLSSLGVKWVADYRYGGPLWIRKILHYRKTEARERRERRYQSRVVGRADLVVTQSDSIKSDFCRAFGLAPEKLRTIPSGYDESDFAERAEPPPFEKGPHLMNVIHAGAAYLGEEERARFASEMNSLARELEAEGRRLSLHALGDDFLGGAASRNELCFAYTYHGVVPHPRLPAYLRAADCYLLSTLTSSAESGAIQGYLPSKMWEYMRGGKPILLFGPRDEVWKIVDEAGAGIYMGSLQNGHRTNGRRLLEAARALSPVRDRVAQHSWQARARAMEDVFHELLATQRKRET